MQQDRIIKRNREQGRAKVITNEGPLKIYAGNAMFFHNFTVTSRCHKHPCPYASNVFSNICSHILQSTLQLTTEVLAISHAQSEKNWIVF